MYDIEKVIYPNEKLLVDKNAPKDEKLEAYNAQTENLKYLFKIAINSDNQSEIDSLLQELTENLNEGQELGLSFDELFNADTRDALNQIISKGYNISEFAKFGKDSGIDITKFFGQDYSKIFSTQIKNLPKGYNVDDFIEWAALSETKITKESWDDAANYIQKRLDEGFNVEKLIDNGAEAGIDWGEAFNGNYMDIIQKQINNGFDPTKLIESWAEVDEKAAEDFKKNSVDVIQKMLDKGFDPTNLMQW
ncbi:MAG: hypothetical protein K2G83_01630, partial [Ruminococcus sp.]|nr:hypothetical protein [Ruminococcus sp.]